MPFTGQAQELSTATTLFQSAPAGEGGRCLAIAPLEARLIRRGGFNPRPPVRAGDAEGRYTESCGSV